MRGQVSVLGLVGLFCACGQSSTPSVASARAQNRAASAHAKPLALEPGLVLGSHLHLTPPRGAIKKDAAPAGAHLNYYGGPVISAVNVWVVYWGSNVAYQGQYEGFYAAVTNSAYFDWLSEYNTSTQAIGRGSLGGSVVDTNAPTDTTIDDSVVQNELATLIDAGKLPANDGNNFYAVYFPPGLTITSSGKRLVLVVLRVPRHVYARQQRRVLLRQSRL